MDAPEIADLLESAAPTPSGTLDIGAIEARARRRHRRRRGVLAGASLVGVGLVVALVALLPGPRERHTVVAGPLSSRPLPVRHTDDGAIVEIALLDGTRLRLGVPEVVGRALADATFGDLELSGSVAVGGAPGRGWRIDVTVDSIERLLPGSDPLPVPHSSGASGARVDRDRRRLGIQFGAWAALVSGESLTQVDIDVLMAGVAVGQTPDGFLVYRGSLPLWIIDSPDAYMTGEDVGVSVFMRECSWPTEPDPRSSTPVQHTAAGLVFWTLDDPDPGRRVTGLCDAAHRIEIWLDTPRPLTDEELDRAGLEVLTVGSTLEAIQRGQRP